MKANKLYKWLFIFVLMIIPSFLFSQNEPVRIGIDGLTHAHVHWILSHFKKKDSPLIIVGIAESNQELVNRLAKDYGFDKSIVFNNVTEMIDKTKPEGVVAFNSIYEHLSTVEACAPRGIHVMVEKPLAVNIEHAEKMANLAKKNNTLLLTNYETTWYPSNHNIYETVIQSKAMGDIKKVMICDGHEGPKEIGCNKEFLDWLTDPVMNGGGAVIDFGCYGANLMTWLMKNELPETVSASLKQMKPDVYPKVDDDAVIILTYPKNQAVIQGSWNWPYSRKDIEVYTSDGYIKAPDGNTVISRIQRAKEASKKPLPLPQPYSDPFDYFTEAIKGSIKVSAEDLSSLENNLIVVKILDAARESAKTGKAIRLK
jgi:predicted dehydrogenase